MITLNVDLSDLIGLRQELEPKTRQVLQDAARDLALQAHGHILEQVQQKLHSTREKYDQALKFEQEGKDTWVVSLDKSAMWIEEGMSEHSMLEDLLASPKAKTSKDGGRYLVVPFEHKKGPTQQTQAAKDLTNTIKSELSRRKIPYAGIEKDASGTPKTGLLHKLDILKSPIKTAEGPGQGKGPMGAARQGPTGIPFLQGIRIYQQRVRDKGGKESVKRSVMTFRTASSKQQGTGRWQHPGLEAKRFFDEAADWALQHWVDKVVPDVLNRVTQTL